jgi:D-3-phosphoglycerate dehydrogenase
LKVLHLDNNHPLIIDQLAKAGYQNEEDYSSKREQLIEKISNYDGVVVRSRITFDKDLIDASRNLKFIARVGSGLESIDVNHATEKGIVVFSSPEGNRNAVGEHALGMLLSLFNNLNKADRQVRNGHWDREGNRGVELEGTTIGIIGYGNMGNAFARKLIGFDCDVICHDIIEEKGNEYAQQVSLKELQERADVVSLHTPWTTLTNKRFDTNFINAFTKPFWLINTARGKSVVTKDLVSALKNGKILGAGLDVLEYESSSFEDLFLSDYMPKELKELFSMDNVILSPHIAGWTKESKGKLAQVIADKIIKRFGNIIPSN